MAMNKMIILIIAVVTIVIIITAFKGIGTKEEQNTNIAPSPNFLYSACKTSEDCIEQSNYKGCADLEFNNGWNIYSPILPSGYKNIVDNDNDLHWVYNDNDIRIIPIFGRGIFIEDYAPSKQGMQIQDYLNEHKELYNDFVEFKFTANPGRNTTLCWN